MVIFHCYVSSPEGKTAARGFVYEHSGIVHSPLLLHVITRYLEDQTLGSMCTRHAVTWVANMSDPGTERFFASFLSRLRPSRHFKTIPFLANPFWLHGIPRVVRLFRIVHSSLCGMFYCLYFPGFPMFS